jgi:transposase
MLILAPSVRVFVARACVDFRRGVDGLCGIVRETFGADPLSGHWFVFTNRRANRLRILVWDRNGFWLATKRLERGTFERFDGVAATIEIDRAKLAMLLDGIDVKESRLRCNFVRSVRIEARDDDARERAAP